MGSALPTRTLAILTHGPPRARRARASVFCPKCWGTGLRGKSISDVYEMSVADAV